MKKSNYSELSIGVVGCGGIGKTHLSKYQMNGIQIKAVADFNPDAVQKVAEVYQCKSYSDYREMLDKEKLDGISICTPPVSHKEISLYALKKKIHVLCEKPLAMNSREAKVMISVSKSKRRILMTAFCHRFQWQIQQTKEWIDSGKLGNIVLYHNRFGGHFNGVEKTWFVQKKISGGGMFIDTLIHSIDLYRYLVDDVKSVKAEYHTFHPKLKVEDSGVITLKSKSGAIGILAGSWQTPAVENVIEIMGTKGSISINYNQNNLRYWFDKDSQWNEMHSHTNGHDRFYLEIQHFLECIQKGKSPMVTGIDGLKSIEIVEKAFSR